MAIANRNVVRVVGLFDEDALSQLNGLNVLMSL